MKYYLFYSEGWVSIWVSDSFLLTSSWCRSDYFWVYFSYIVHFAYLWKIFSLCCNCEYALQKYPNYL